MVDIGTVIVLDTRLVVSFLIGFASCLGLIWMVQGVTPRMWMTPLAGISAESSGQGVVGCAAWLVIIFVCMLLFWLFRSM
jgi:hypothetical protein